jgi:aspartate racemase
MIAGKKTIGIVGGVGPYAGLDLNQKIFDNTVAATDQDHLSVILISTSAEIADRTRYLLQLDVENPAKNLFKVITDLHKLGAAVAGIPCNTAHAEPIFSVLTHLISEGGLNIKLLNMISEVMTALKAELNYLRVGVLSTLGTHKNSLYETYMNKAGIPMVQADDELAGSVHQAIYHPEYGIKAQSNPVTSKARALAKTAVRKLANQGADIVILGCTELPLALTGDYVDGIKLIDPTTILARALIRYVDPEKLKPMGNVNDEES